MKVAIRFVFMLALALFLSACEGFHLRGYGGGASLEAISPLYISGLAETDELYRILRAYLPQYGVTLVNNREAAKQELTIFERQTNKKVHSVTGRGKALEYELTEGFAYYLGSTPDAVARDSANRLSVRRVYTSPGAQVLGKGNEEVQILRDMRQQLAIRLIRLLSAKAN